MNVIGGQAIVVGALLVIGCATARADKVGLRTSEAQFNKNRDANVLLVQLVNGEPLQGLQFRLTYDYAVVRPGKVMGLGGSRRP